MCRVLCLAALLLATVSLRPSDGKPTTADASPLVASIETTGNTTTADLFPLSLVHWSDFHARFEPINNFSASCQPAGDAEVADEERPQCFGGYARIVSTVRRLMDERRATNPLYVNAGDNFQGTFWYNVGRWNVTAQFLNLLPADAITIGNHEFSHSVEGLVPFLRAVRSPFVACNIDATDEPTMRDLFQPSLIIRRFAQPIGIIGVTLSNMPEIARTGRLRFLDEVTAVREEAARLRAAGIRIIIVLSHCGIDVDQRIAREAGADIDVIVGGHSHTFMYHGANPANEERPRYDYPMVIRPEAAGSRQVLIVHASAFTRWVGDFTVYFSQRGEAVSWTGNPVFQAPDIEGDALVEQQMVPWRQLIGAEGARVLATTRVPFVRDECFRRECNLGNLMAEAAVDHYRRHVEPEAGAWTRAAIAVMNVGAARTTLPVGEVRMSDLMTTMPFENTFDLVELRGEHVLEMLELAVSRSWSQEEFVGPLMLHFAGLRVTYNVRLPIGGRVTAVSVRCHRCPVPSFQPLQPATWYPLIIPSFLYAGGDGYTVFGRQGRQHRVGPRDVDVMTEYMGREDPLTTGLDGRIGFVTE